MKILIMIIGTVCVIYGFVKKRRKRAFRSVLDDVEKESADKIVDSLDSDVLFTDSMDMGRAVRQMESDFINISNSKRALEDRVTLIENLLQDFKPPRQHIEQTYSGNSKSLKKEFYDKLDFNGKSLEELSMETGLDKGELLLLKKNYQK
ncbi:MAG: hypothetical protein JJE29_01390 [Peptostreptococcaceae bacterium]|nr:hypothetical protein [Peptostreptococcaceae bacterium]